MSGSAVAPEPRSDGKKQRKKTRRLGIRIDMTPLVDVAFLLLTFFMLTTSMNRPQTMEINIPPNPWETVPTGERHLLTLRVDEDSRIFWAIGMDSPRMLEVADLRGFLRERAAADPRLVTLVKIDRESKYETMVNIMDELNLANIQRFSLGRLEEEDRNMVAKVRI